MEERFLAFIDVLGFKYIVEETDKALYIIDTLEKVKEEREKLAREGGYDDSMKITWFSDSIVLSYPTSNYYNIKLLVQDIKDIQRTLMIHGILIRGGIDVNECYHDNIKLFGLAMNEAYNLESTKAIVPRVIISDKVMEYLEDLDAIEEGILEQEFERSLKYGDDDLEYNKERYIESVTINQVIRKKFVRKDNDGIYFVDYLGEIIDSCIHTIEYENLIQKSITGEKLDTSYKSYKHFCEEIYSDWIKPIRQVIQCNLKNNPLGVILKYMWLKDYFNTTVDTKKSSMSKEFVQDFYERLLIDK